MLTVYAFGNVPAPVVGETRDLRVLWGVVCRARSDPRLLRLRVDDARVCGIPAAADARKRAARVRAVAAYPRQRGVPCAGHQPRG